MSKAVCGYVALLLHAHLPYVRQQKEDRTLEERWFYEAVTESYLPLIEMMDRLLEDGIRFHLTLSISPTLLAMLADPLMRHRTRKHLAMLRELAQKEVLRLWGDTDFAPAAHLYESRFRRLEKLYDRLGGDLIGKLRSLRDTGCIELITCAATHAFLPLVKNGAALRAQLEAAVTEFRRHFGAAPAGIWLPECGYTPAVEPHLQALGLRYFVVDAHAHALAVTTPQAKAAAGAPLRTQSGAYAFARDPEASTQVWSAETGYPGDADYREYYRDIGFDLGRDGGPEWAYIKPYVLPDGERIHTGLKYYRVTGPDTDAKEPYRPERAALKARQHAGHFVAARTEQFRRLAAEREAQHGGGTLPPPAAPPVIVCPYDAELFGHWWYEGPQWLEAVLRGFASAQESDVVVETTTLMHYTAKHPAAAEAKLPSSSWGRGGFAEVWLQPQSQWVYPRLHAAEDRIIRAAEAHEDPGLLTDVERRLLNQAARELMLAQSSDWTFILDAGTFTEYAELRITEHLASFHMLMDAFEQSKQDPPAAFRRLEESAFEAEQPQLHLHILTNNAEIENCRLSGLTERLTSSCEGMPEEQMRLLQQLEERSPLLPELSYTCYKPHAHEAKRTDATSRIEQHTGSLRALVPNFRPVSATSGLRILMLAWEYPPNVIGGLSRAVCDLSRQLAASGHHVHVMTCHTANCPSYEMAEQVHVHRVQLLQSIKPVNFLDWVFQMNMAFFDAILELVQQGLQFDVVHAHDWLVFYAAKESKQTLGIPLVATMHATEFGRNQGKLETELQQRIHALEAKLTLEADRVIACSLAMREEVQRLFHLSACKVVRIPNGVVPYRESDAAAPIRNTLLLDSLGPEIGLELDLSHRTRDRIICFLGRLVHEKGVHVLIQALADVLKRIPNVLLIIAGAGPLQEQLQSQAAPYGDRVRFTGFLDDTDKRRLLRASELCIFPSLYEPFGLVALEAMACGTPLIVSDVGGLAEIVEPNIDGCIVPPGEAAILSNRIVELLEQPQLRQQYAAAAVHKAETMYDWGRIRESTVEIYHAVTQSLS